MNRLTSRHKTAWLLFLIVLCSRLLYLMPGYGSEDDSWGLILNAREMWATGQYSFSRLPGHPVQEYVLYCLPEKVLNVWVCNGLSAVFSALSVVFFWLILQHYRAAQTLLWTVVFATVPLVWISGTYTIDYSWGLCFQLGAFWAVLRQRLLWAALCLGLAAGCRIPSGAFGLVLLPLLYEGKLNGWLRQSLRLGLPALLIAVLCYTPALMRYGSGFFDFYTLPYPALPKTLYKASIGVWGFTGSLALLMLPFVLKETTTPRPLQQATWMAVLVFGAGFLVYPHKSAFLLPLVPLVLLVFALSTTKGWPRLAAVLCLLGAFTFGLNFSDPERGARPGAYALQFKVGAEDLFIDPFKGPLRMEAERRRNRLIYCRRALLKCQSLPPGSVVLCGWWTNHMRELALQLQTQPLVRLEEFLSPAQLQLYRAENRKVYFLDEIDHVNDQRYGMVFTAQWARALEEG